MGMALRVWDELMDRQRALSTRGPYVDHMTMEDTSEDKMVGLVDWLADKAETLHEERRR